MVNTWLAICVNWSCEWVNFHSAIWHTITNRKIRVCGDLYYYVCICSCKWLNTFSKCRRIFINPLYIHVRYFCEYGLFLYKVPTLEEFSDVTFFFCQFVSFSFKKFWNSKSAILWTLTLQEVNRTNGSSETICTRLPCKYKQKVHL